MSTRVIDSNNSGGKLLILEGEQGEQLLTASTSAQGVGFTSTMQLTQAQYDALAVKDAAVMYVIVG